MFTLDECGFGTSSLRQYGYSKRGTPAKHFNSKLSHNLSLVCTLGPQSVELI